VGRARKISPQILCRAGQVRGGPMQGGPARIATPCFMGSCIYMLLRVLVQVENLDP